MNPIDPKEAREKIMARLQQLPLADIQVSSEDAYRDQSVVASYIYACMLELFPLSPLVRTHLRGNYELESVNIARALTFEHVALDSIKAAFIHGLTKHQEYYYDAKALAALDDFYRIVADNFFIGTGYYAKLCTTANR